MSELPTGTVTLLLADVEGSTRLWETQPDAMTDAVARLDRSLTDWSRPTTVSDLSSRVRATASWWRSRAPATRWRVRWSCNGATCSDPASHRRAHRRGDGCATKATTSAPPSIATARLRDLAHGGQTVLVGCHRGVGVRSAARRCVADRSGHARAARCRAPGTGDAAVPSRSSQRVPTAADVANTAVPHRLPAQFTSFVGRGAQIAEVRRLLAEHRLVTLDRRRWGGQDPSRHRDRRPDGGRLRRRRLVCRSGADHPSRPRAGHGGASARAAGPTGSLDSGDAAAVHPRPSDAGGVGQLRASAGGRRRLAPRCWAAARG